MRVGEATDEKVNPMRPNNILEDTEPLYDLIEPVDVVIMNPPFGTKIKGIDMVFLQKAIEVSSLRQFALLTENLRSPTSPFIAYTKPQQEM